MHYARYLRTGQTNRKSSRVKKQRTYIYNGKEFTYRKSYELMYKYKMTQEEFDERASKGCEICGIEQTDRSFHVDHDHNCCDGLIACGKCVRGVICSRCNVAVEKYESNKMRADNPIRDMIVKYMEVWK